MKTNFCASQLLKSDMIKFFPNYKEEKLSKAEMSVVIDEMINNDEELRMRLIEENNYRLSISSYEVEKLLQCTATERRRWHDKGLLTIKEYKTVYKYGKSVECPLYDRLEIERLDITDVEKFRLEHECLKLAKRVLNKQATQEKRKATIAKNKKIKENFIKLETYVNNSLEQLENKETIELLYWTIIAYEIMEEKTQTMGNADYKYIRKSVELLTGDKLIKVLRHKKGRNYYIFYQYNDISFYLGMDIFEWYVKNKRYNVIKQHISNGIYIGEESIDWSLYKEDEAINNLLDAIDNYETKHR